MAAKLTTQALNRKPGDRDIWLTDPSPKGKGLLQARITTTGKKGFYFRYTNSNGGRQRLPLGSYDPDGISGLTLKQAREKAGTLSQLYQSGILDIKEHLEEQERIALAERKAEEAKLEAERIEAEQLSKRLTVRQLFDKWRQSQLINRKDGGAYVLRMFTKDVFPAIGHMYADEIKKGHIAEIVDSILARGANRVAKMVFSDMRQMFKWALYRDWIEYDPTAAIKKSDIGKKDTERERVLTEDEIVTLAEKIPEARLLPTTEAAIWIPLATCCRIGELLKARWEHIDLDKREWFIPAENSKNGVALTINLSDFAVKQFQTVYSMHHYSQWLYPNRKDTDHVCTKTITKQLSDRQRSEAMTNRSSRTDTLTLPGGYWSPHDLRRTAATLLAMMGVSPIVIERCLNHVEQNKMQRVYQRYSYQSEMNDAWKRLGSRLEALKSGKKVAKVTPLKRKA
nr:tyrosine-type recombinase/integrase [uncultured Desulfuromonas sp.]